MAMAGDCTASDGAVVEVQARRELLASPFCACTWTAACGERPKTMSTGTGNRRVRG